MTNERKLRSQRRVGWLDMLGIALALVAFLAAIKRMTSLETVDVAFGWITLGYLAATAAFILVPRIREFSMGDVKVVMDSFEERLEEVHGLALAAESGVGHQAEQKSDSKGEALNGVPGLAAEVPPGPDKEDPWKGAFGGKSERDGLRLSASVRATSDRNWFLVTIAIGPSPLNGNELDGPVRLYLHPTFPNHMPLRFPDPDGRVEITMRAWGAFTVGCAANAGKTRLELDLSEDRSFPRVFRSR